MLHQLYDLHLDILMMEDEDEGDGKTKGVAAELQDEAWSNSRVAFVGEICSLSRQNLFIILDLYVIHWLELSISRPVYWPLPWPRKRSLRRIVETIFQWTEPLKEDS